MRNNLQNRGNHPRQGHQRQIDPILEHIHIRVRKAQTHEKVEGQLKDIDPKMNPVLLAPPPQIENLILGQFIDHVVLEILLLPKSVQEQKQVQNQRQEVPDQPKGKANLPKPGHRLPLHSALLLEIVVIDLTQIP